MAGKGGVLLRCCFVCAALAVSTQVPAAAAPEKPLFAPSLPLKRDAADEGVGTGTAAVAAAAVLLAGVWAAAQYRGRQRGAARKPGAAILPWISRILPDAQARQLRVVETAALGAHARLHVVQWQGQEYLLSATADNVSILDRRVLPAEAAMSEPKDAA
jgi:hypothetical protein